MSKDTSEISQNSSRGGGRQRQRALGGNPPFVFIYLFAPLLPIPLTPFRCMFSTVEHGNYVFLSPKKKEEEEERKKSRVSESVFWSWFKSRHCEESLKCHLLIIITPFLTLWPEFVYVTKIERAPPPSQPHCLSVLTCLSVLLKRRFHKNSLGNSLFWHRDSSGLCCSE